MGRLGRGRKDDIDVASCLANVGRLDAIDPSRLVDAPSSDQLDAPGGAAAAPVDTSVVVISILDGPRTSPAVELPRERTEDDLIVLSGLAGSVRDSDR